MKGKAGVFVILIVVVAMFSFAKCSKSRCEVICEWADDCESMSSGEMDYCVEHCRTDYKKAPGDCSDATATLADCLDGRDCAEGDDSCGDEFDDYADECWDW